jgi:hypothetical protein
MMISVKILPVYFECPICHQPVKRVVEDGSRVGCECVVVDYDGRKLAGRDNIIPSPGEILPRLQEGHSVDVRDIQEETVFRWGRLVEEVKLEAAAPAPKPVKAKKPPRG